MADSYHTSRFTLSGSFFSAVQPSQSLSDQLLINPDSPSPAFSDAHIAELMETLRRQINLLLRTSIPAQKRSRLVRSYWELEYLVKEIRLIVGTG